MNCGTAQHTNAQSGLLKHLLDRLKDRLKKHLVNRLLVARCCALRTTESISKPARTLACSLSTMHTVPG